MRAVAHVAFDLLLEARSRRWFLVLAAAISLVLGAIALFLQLDVVDGTLAATRLFGQALGANGEAVDHALRPLFAATAWIVFYGGISFGIVACSDFGPRMVGPGRIELLLSLPLHRIELLVGTWLGVLCIALLGATWGAGGLTLILGWKTGVWTLGPLAAGALACLTFATIHAAMLAVSLWARSAALSAMVGFALFFAGVVAGYRDQALAAFQAGFGRELFRWATLALPRISAVSRDAMAIAGSDSVDPVGLAARAGAMAAFAGAALALAAWRFEGKDF